MQIRIQLQLQMQIRIQLKKSNKNTTTTRNTNKNTNTNAGSGPEYRCHVQRDGDCSDPRAQPHSLQPGKVKKIKNTSTNIVFSTIVTNTIMTMISSLVVVRKNFRDDGLQAYTDVQTVFVFVFQDH